MLRAAASTYCMSAEPSSSGGVPTAMNCSAPCATAASLSVVKRRRPAATLRAIIAARPGSWIGTPPPFRISILRASTSRHSTSLPTSARQVPVTRPDVARPDHRDLHAASRQRCVDGGERRDRIRGLRDRSADHEIVGAVGDRGFGRDDARLVVLRAAGGPDAGRDELEARTQRRAQRRRLDCRADDAVEAARRGEPREAQRLLRRGAIDAGRARGRRRRGSSAR